MQLERILRIGVSVGLLSSALFFSVPAEAEIRLGAQGGVALTTTSTNEKGTELGTLTRWGAGAVLEADLSPTLAVVTRPQYVGRGNNIKSMPELGSIASLNNGSYARVELDYIELPLLVKYSLPTGTTRPYLIAGPSLGWLQRARGVSKFGSAAEEREDIKKDFKSTDIGVQVGAGIGTNLGRTHMFVEGLYGFGLTNISKDKAEGTGKSRGLQLRAGVAVRLGGR
jgi:hypothetical protein